MGDLNDCIVQKMNDRTQSIIWSINILSVYYTTKSRYLNITIGNKLVRPFCLTDNFKHNTGIINIW
jgi:hypothetical protein